MAHIRTPLVVLVLILAATIGTRTVGFFTAHPFTFDEILYATMGKQLLQDPFHYTSRPLYDLCVSGGRELPDYLARPLFKHPPLFSYAIAFMYVITQTPHISMAWAVSLLSGLGMIVAVYASGALLFDRRTGLMAAFLLFLDPVHWICSQKIWMETTLACLVWLSFFLLLVAVKKHEPRFFILAGLSTGAAILTKYTAFLLFPAGLTILFIYDRAFFQKRYWWGWPGIGMLVFIPWLLWNHVIYGKTFFLEMLYSHRAPSDLLNLNIMSSTLIFVVCLMVLLAVIIRNRGAGQVPDQRRLIILRTLCALCLFANPYVAGGLVTIFDIHHIPRTGWTMGMFAGEPPLFYIRRLIELSPFYVIALFSIVFPVKKNKGDLCLIAVSSWLMFFLIIIGNYQSRYALIASAGLLLLAARVLTAGVCYSSRVPSTRVLRLTEHGLIIAIFAYAVLKTALTGVILAIPNATCYF